jgi:hypothetical protein
MSTHMCDIKFDGLPFLLTGHIVPALSIASLFGIHILTEAGCTVTFDKNFCTVRCNGTIILQGKKDVANDLWTLPLGMPSTSTHHGAATTLSVAPVIFDIHARHSTRNLHFSHTLCKTQPIVSNLPIRLYAVCTSPHYSKQSDVATSKGAPT